MYMCVYVYVLVKFLPWGDANKIYMMDSCTRHSQSNKDGSCSALMIAPGWVMVPREHAVCVCQQEGCVLRRQ